MNLCYTSIHLLLLILGLLIYSHSHSLAQVNQLVSGYLIDADGDTIQTQIFLGSDRDLSQRVLFKPTANTPILQKKPFEVLGFGFGDDHIFEAVAIEDGLFQDSVFVEQIFIGTLSLYKTADEKGKLLFLIKKENGDWTPLLKDAWKPIMTVLLSDATDEDLLRSIQSTRYASKPLADLLSRYQASIDSDKEPIRRRRRHTVFTKGITARIGPRAAFFPLTSDLEGRYDGSQYSVGIYTRAQLAHRLSLRGELSYMSSELYNKETFSIWTNETEARFSSLTVQGIIEYNAFVSHRLIIYPLAGGGIIYNMTEEVRRKTSLLGADNGQWTEWISLDWKESVEVFGGVGFSYSLGGKKEVFLEVVRSALNGINTIRSGIINGVNLHVGIGF